MDRKENVLLSYILVNIIPLFKRTCGLVTATTMTVSAIQPFVMKVLLPFKIQSSPSFFAFVRIPCKSLQDVKNLLSIYVGQQNSKEHMCYTSWAVRDERTFLGLSSSLNCFSMFYFMYSFIFKWISKGIYLPAPGSLIAMAPMFFPEVMAGMNFSICSFEP